MSTTIRMMALILPGNREGRFLIACISLDDSATDANVIDQSKKKVLGRIRQALVEKRQIFVVSRCSLDRGFNCPRGVEAKSTGHIEDFLDRLAPSPQIAYDTAPADVGFPDLELRLDQNNYVGDRRSYFNDHR